MHRYERHIQRERQAFCETQPNEEATNEPRTVRDSNRVDILTSNASRFKRFLKGVGNHREVFPTRLLRHDATRFAMNCSLTAHNVRQYFRAFPRRSTHHTNAGVVARCVDTENVLHCTTS